MVLFQRCSGFVRFSPSLKSGPIISYFDCQGAAGARPAWMTRWLGSESPSPCRARHHYVDKFQEFCRL